MLTTAAVWANGNKDSTGTTTLRFGFWGGDERIAIYNQICDRYEADNPGIKIVREPSSFDDYFNKLATQVAGGAAPDVISMHPRYYNTYVNSKALLPLENLTKSGAIDISHFSTPATDMGTVNGQLYAISIGMVASGLFLNDEILKEVGIPISRLEAVLDWSDFETICNEIYTKSKGKYWGAADDSFNPVQSDNIFLLYLKTRGKDIFTGAGKLGFNKDDLVAFWSMYDRLRKSNGVPSPTHSGEIAGLTWEQGDFAMNKVALMFLNANRLSIFQNAMPNTHITMVRIPRNNGKVGEYIEGSALTINARSKLQAEAAKFINYFVNNKRSMELYQIQNGFPGSTLMSEYVYTLLDKSTKEASQFMDKVTGGGALPPYILPPDNRNDVINLLTAEAQNVAYGKKTIDKAADDFFAAYGRL
jgi:multiple sugar transport system substrate-binding protein